MSPNCDSCDAMKERIKELEIEVQNLKDQLNNSRTQCSSQIDIKINSTPATGKQNDFTKCLLSNKDIERFSRQMILPEIGVKGQIHLQQSSILIVGAGGLGCPAALYLVAAGVGTIGLVDYDVVDLSNLHRQVVHNEEMIGIQKVDSIVKQLSKLNSSTKFEKHFFSLNSSNAMEIVKKYDIVLDCTDNVATRYLLNDTCVLAKKPLVSGSALRFEGQLTVYNYNDGPCYRCLYPTPPPVESVTNCSDGGVVGAVTGVIGSIQALEALKIITGNNSSYSGKLLLFDGLGGTFRTIKLRGKKDTCVVCGSTPSITQLQDYEQFCGTKATDKDQGLELLPTEQRINVQGFSKLRLSTPQDSSYVLIDVRSHIEYEICSLNPSKNIPINDVLSNKNIEEILSYIQSYEQVFFVCKRGNDSQKAVQAIRKKMKEHGRTDEVKVKDIIGGLTAWSKRIDREFPTY